MKRKINYRKIIFLILLVYLGYFLVGQYQTMNRISAETKNQKLLLEKAKDEQDKLQDELANTPRYQEKLARQMFNLVKDGERTVIDSAKK